MNVARIVGEARCAFCLLLLVLSLLATPVQAQTKARLTEAQAIQIARQFCQRIGQPRTDAATAQYPAPEDFPDQPNQFWQTCWKISFGHDVDVNVIDMTGIVRGYDNKVYYHKPLAEQNLPVEDFISEQEALQKAAFVLQATRQAEELSAPKATFEAIARPVKHGTTDWCVRWVRLSHGIPYREDGAAVYLDGESGEVISAGLGYFSPPAPAFTERISHTEAAALTGRVMTEVGLLDATLKNDAYRVASRRMERPNTFWQNGDESHPLAGPARPVDVQIYQEGMTYYEVWTDLETGQVIGGSQYSFRGSLGKPKFKHFLPNRKQPVSAAKVIKRP